MGILEIPRDMLSLPGNTMGFMRDSLWPHTQKGFVERLRQEEPRTRARTALGAAARAMNRHKPDYELAVFESWRASGAALFIAQQEQELIIPRADIDLVRAVKRGVVGFSDQIAHPPETRYQEAQQFLPIGMAAVQLANQAQAIAAARPQEVAYLDSVRR